MTCASPAPPELAPHDHGAKARRAVLPCLAMKPRTIAATALLFAFVPPMHAQPAPVQDSARNIAKQVEKVRAANAHRSTPFHADWDSLAQYRTPEWFRDAKFGIFLHWGVYSVPAYANEWYSRNMYIRDNDAYKHQVATYGPLSKFGYKDFIPMFKAEHFDPKAWVDLFAQAGARYVVPVAEHCDGFAMYASDITPWNASLMGPKRDVVGELATATRARGLRFGVSSHVAEHWWWYGDGRSFDSDVRTAMSSEPAPLDAQLYGPAEAMNPNGPDGDVVGTPADAKEPNASHLELWLPPDRKWLDNWLARSTELVDKYHPDFYYFDFFIGQPAYKPDLQQFAAYYYSSSAQRNQQPVLTYKGEDMPANTATLDMERSAMQTERLLPWQTDTSISVHSWGYVDHDEYRTADSLIQQLVDTVSKNGNLLLNVGPKSDGTIAEEARTVLLQIGAWLKVNGEAIYGSRPFTVFGEGPIRARVPTRDPNGKGTDIQAFTAKDIRFTTSHDGSILYATALGEPSDGSLLMHTLYRDNPYLAAPVCRVQLLGSPGDVAFKQQPDGLQITFPASAPASQAAYVFRIATHC